MKMIVIGFPKKNILVFFINFKHSSREPYRNESIAELLGKPEKTVPHHL